MRGLPLSIEPFSSSLDLTKPSLGNENYLYAVFDFVLMFVPRVWGIRSGVLTILKRFLQGKFTAIFGQADRGILSECPSQTVTHQLCFGARNSGSSIPTPTNRRRAAGRDLDSHACRISFAS